MATKTMKKADIRAELPVVVKSGTSHKPVWTMETGEVLRFVAPLDKAGRDVNGNKPRLGKRFLGKYKAGVTAAGADLMFVGVFALVK